jgi:hypothetical protein
MDAGPRQGARDRCLGRRPAEWHGGLHVLNTGQSGKVLPSTPAASS